MSLTDLVNRTLFAGALATASIGAIGVAENVAYAQRVETIEEHYKHSQPADYLIPSARMMKAGEGDRVLGKSDLFKGAEFARLYLEDQNYAPGLQAIFRELDGKMLHNPHTEEFFRFDFNKFHTFMLQNRQNLAGTLLFDSGYINMVLRPAAISVTLPLPVETIQKIYNL